VGTTANQIILNEPIQVAAANISFTAAEWSAMLAQINSDMYTTLWIGLVIGIAVGLVTGMTGLYLGMKYCGNPGE
jgi:ABC-type nitrate/sulfonate/bicarbonate transport system permease component